MLSVLNSISSLNAQNALSATQANLQKTLTQLSTGLRVNSGADDAAGLSIANGLQGNIAALTQSATNAANGIGVLQTADGALAQVTALLNRAVTLATEASNSGLSDDQYTALDGEFQTIITEIGNIGGNTTFNGSAVFQATVSPYISDGTSDGTVAGIDLTMSDYDPSSVLSGALTDADAAADALTAVNTAITDVAGYRGTIGASINQLQAAQNVINAEVTNLTSAVNDIQNADISKTVANMTQFNILQQTGMAALSQSNQAQQSVLKLLQ